MIGFIIFVFLFINGNSVLSLSLEGPRPSDIKTETRAEEQNIDFSIEIQTKFVNGYYSGQDSYSRDFDYSLSDTDSIKITCKRKDNGYITWKDNFAGWSTISNAKTFTLTLNITTDVEDINKTFTCTNYVDNVSKNITLTLKSLNKNTRQSKYQVNTVVKLQKGKTWNSGYCYDGVASYPGYGTRTGSVTKLLNYGNHTVIESFNEEQNGTRFSCIEYKEITNNDKTSEVLYKRVKKQYIFYLDSETIPITEHGQENTNAERNVELADNTKTKNGQEKTMDNQLPNNNTQRETSVNPSQENENAGPAALVGGVLGAIALLLLGVLLGIWYTSTRQRPPDDRAIQVIYAEIQERQTAPPPPPPRNPVAYTEVIGTLVPNPVNCETRENPYSTINCVKKEDPYSTINCVPKENPYSTINHVTKEDPYSTINHVTKEDPYSTIN